MPAKRVRADKGPSYIMGSTPQVVAGFSCPQCVMSPLSESIYKKIHVLQLEFTDEVLILAGPVAVVDRDAHGVGQMLLEDDRIAAADGDLGDAVTGPVAHKVLVLAGPVAVVDRD